MLQNAKNDAALSWELLFVSARHYLKKQSPTDPYASPIFAQFRDFPPIMVHAGSNEILRDDASRIGDRAAEAGVPVSVEIYDGMQHVFQASAYVPEARVSLAAVWASSSARARRNAQAKAAVEFADHAIVADASVNAFGDHRLGKSSRPSAWRRRVRNRADRNR